MADSDPWDDDEIIDFHNSLLDQAPDDWDGDEGQPAIIKRWVDHLVGEVKRRSGCLLPFCHHWDGEACDHGYAPDPVPHFCTPGCTHPVVEVSPEVIAHLQRLSGRLGAEDE